MSLNARPHLLRGRQPSPQSTKLGKAPPTLERPMARAPSGARKLPSPGMGLTLMNRVSLPKIRTRVKKLKAQRTFPAHRAWVRRHHCCVPGCDQGPIECAHVRRGTDGGVAMKPSDRFTLSLCQDHHREQHQIGEAVFERRYGVDLMCLAAEFARRSPHRHLWESCRAHDR